MMASPSSELSLECKPHSYYTMLLKSFGEKVDQTQNLEEFLARLEEERLKIDAFKRELPLCMQLLTNAMEASKQQLQSYRENSGGGRRPVLEEFIPLKNNTSVEGTDKVINNSSDKANWMTTAQLWSPGGNDQETKQQSCNKNIKSDHMGFSVSPLDHNNNNHKEEERNGSSGGAFHPFSQGPGPIPSPTLALASSNNNQSEVVSLVADHNDNKNLETLNNNNNNATLLEQTKVVDHTISQNNNNNVSNNQPQRKARRCWSPDLHRRFVNALQMLGGSQVATPKQIRELMKVDGLTNDEVKSHLQKYRLHTRRPSPSPQATTTAPQLVVLGGIWVPPEYAAAHGGASPAATLYGAHPTSHAPAPHYIAAPPAQEFYSSTPQPLQSIQHQHQQLLHMYKPPSNSPDSAAGHRSESIEDGKSESSSQQ